MTKLDNFNFFLNQALIKLKESDINAFLKPDEIKELFKNALSLENCYWELNKDCEKLTKLGLIFRPQQTCIQKGKPIYVGFLFESLFLTVLLEEQYARTKNNTFEIPYTTILNNWDEFSENMISIFNKASDLANGIRL